MTPSGTHQMPSPSGWDPASYLAFAGYRALPAQDLLARIDLRPEGPIYDLGCGPGNITRKLKDRWPDRAVTGLDSSPQMLAAARKNIGEQGDDQGGDRGIIWREGDIATWSADQPAALIFANAALHWVANHDALFPRLMTNLAPAGVLAVQMPKTARAPYHECLKDVAGSAKWRGQLGRIDALTHPYDAGAYYDLLSSSASDVDIWDASYHHVMPDLNAVLAWTQGTALVPYLKALKDDEQPAFLADYKAALGADYPSQTDGKILFTMARIFIVAKRRV